mgnify:CR=1 FL=1
MNGMEEVYIACTEGGEARLGQIWKYRPSSAEGTPQENDDNIKWQSLKIKINKEIMIKGLP